jgi:hypothetical protein
MTARTPTNLLFALLAACSGSAPGGGDDDDQPDAAIPQPDAEVVDPSVPPEVDARIVINEVMAENALTAVDEAEVAGDWAELYNPTDRDIPLHGYFLTDDLAVPQKWFIPDGLILPAGGYLIFWLDNTPDRGPRHAAFALDEDGDELGLARNDGSWIDRVVLGDQATDFSAAREPDGSDAWKIEWHASPGEANPDGTGAPVAVEDPAAPPEQIPAAGDLTERILGYDALPALQLLVSPASLEALAANPRVYAPADLVFDGRRYGPIGVRVKGQDTFQPFSQKPSLRINVDEYVPRAKFFGLDDLTLNNMASDRSMMHERLAYLVVRELGLPASRATHATLEVNGLAYGLYTCVETVKWRMVKRWFADPTGPLFESTGADYIAAQIPMFEHESGPDDRSLLISLAEAMTIADPDQAMAAAAAFVDIDHFQRLWGAFAVIGQLDSFPTYTDDYFQYADPTSGKLHFMPWGMDETFSSSSYDVTMVNEILGKTCKASPACLQAFADRAWQAQAKVEDMNLLAEVDRVAEQIAPLVAADQRRPYTLEDVQHAQQSIRYFLNERRSKLSGMLPAASQ